MGARVVAVMELELAFAEWAEMGGDGHRISAMLQGRFFPILITAAEHPSGAARPLHLVEGLEQRLPQVRCTSLIHRATAANDMPAQRAGGGIDGDAGRGSVKSVGGGRDRG